MQLCLGCEFKVVDVDDQKRLRFFVPIHSRPLFSEPSVVNGEELIFAVFLPETTCVGVAVKC